MELKLFGPGGYPSSRFKAGLIALFELDDKAWDTLATWFLTSDLLEVYKGRSSATVLASALTPEQFEDSAQVLLWILQGWHQRGIQLNEILRDLMVLGHPAEHIERLSVLLNRLTPISPKAYATYMRGYHQSAAIPTLLDVDLICDIRPVFENYNYFVGKLDGLSHSKILEFSCMVLADFKTEDSSEKTRTFSFQMNEDTLAELQKGLTRAAEQLKILKAKIGKINFE